MPDFDIKMEPVPGTKEPIDWGKLFRDRNPQIILAPREHLRPRSDMEDAASYLAMGCPRIIGFDNARGHDKSVAHKIMLLEHAQNRGRTLALQHGGGGPYVYLDGPLTESDFCFTITQGKPMQDIPTAMHPTPTKQFVTHDVPGFENGHPLDLTTGYIADTSAFRDPRQKFIAKRMTEEGVEIIATLPFTASAFAAHVRVKAVKPPKVEKKA